MAAKYTLCELIFAHSFLKLSYLKHEFLAHYFLNSAIWYFICKQNEYFEG